MIVVKNKKQGNWYTNVGVAVKQNWIKEKGFPNTVGAKFVTLTVDRERFESPEKAYEVGTERCRRFMQELKKFYGKVYYDEGQRKLRRIRWCRKLELHEDGYPHWHFIIFIKKKLCPHVLQKAWGLCPVNGVDIEHIKSDKFEYLFKYVTKDTGTESGLPNWVLDYPKQIRFWQTSVGFYDGYTRQYPNKGEKKFSRLHIPIRRQIETQKKTLEIIISTGRKVHYKVRLMLRINHRDMVKSIMRKWAFRPSDFQYYEDVVKIRIKTLYQYIEKWQSNKIKQLEEKTDSVMLSLESWYPCDLHEIFQVRTENPLLGL